jgi:hypothetical protein
VKEKRGKDAIKTLNSQESFLMGNESVLLPQLKLLLSFEIPRHLTQTISLIDSQFFWDNNHKS